MQDLEILTDGGGCINEKISKTRILISANKEKLRKFRKEYAKGNMSMDEILKSLNSYSGHLKHGNTYRLQQHVYSNCVFKTDKFGTEKKRGQ